MAASRPSKWRNRLVAGVLVACLCLACTGSPNGMTAGAPTSTAEVTQVASAATVTVQGEITERPTAKPVETETPAVTATPLPATITAARKTAAAATQLALPTHTPKPTATDTPIPTPILLTGTGDSVVDAENPFGPALVRITGNAGSRFFGVTSYGADNEQIESLVLTTDPYSGTRPLDFRDGQHTVRFEVQAVGAWTIELLPLTSIRRMTVPGTVEGTGDDVIFLEGAAPDTATITGNADERFFAVTGWGTRIDSLVLTTDAYDGKVIMRPDTSAIEVQAVGPWTIQVDN